MEVVDHQLGECVDDLIIVAFGGVLSIVKAAVVVVVVHIGVDFNEGVELVLETKHGLVEEIEEAFVLDKCRCGRGGG